MTRILTIIALLFATPMLAACVSAVTIKENKSFGNGFTPLPADGKAVKLRDWRHFVMPSD